MSLLLLLACAGKSPAEAPAATPSAQVRARPQPDADSPTLQRIPGAQQDGGMDRSVMALVGAARDPGVRLPTAQTLQARAQAGYPCPATYLRELTGDGAQPERLLAELEKAALSESAPVDLALASRDFSDSGTLWIAGICPVLALLDPIPRDIGVGDPVPVSVELAAGQDWELQLFVDPPVGPVTQQPLSENVASWYTRTEHPGEYRFEVVGSRPRESRVLLLWSVFVDQEPAALDSLPRAQVQAPDPMAATEALYRELNRIRQEAGLAPVTPFPAFEPLAREQAATLAYRGVVAHSLSGLPTLAERAEAGFHPRALHYENVAAAPTWQEASDLVALSPGHAMNLLCERCTHASIGVALEPVTDRVPRLFVVWELLEFPDGEPVEIRRFAE